MDYNSSWSIWSVKEIEAQLPHLITKVESNLTVFQQGDREQYNRVAQSLRTIGILTEPRMQNRIRELLSSLGFALEFLGEKANEEGKLKECLSCFHAAHEMFRAGHLASPSNQMQKVLIKAIKVIIENEAKKVWRGMIDAVRLHDQLKQFAQSTWPTVPPHLELSINELLLNELEGVRQEGKDDRATHDEFIRNNIEIVIGLDIPASLEAVRTRWVELGVEIAPNITRMAKRGTQRPLALSELIQEQIWDKLEDVVSNGDIRLLGETLSAIEEPLKNNLRLHLKINTDYHEPSAELRSRKGPDRHFIEARELLMRKDPRALEKFKEIHYHRPTFAIVKEWYAYALSVFGRRTDVWTIVDLLKDAIASPFYRPDQNWTARWNLACALQQVHREQNALSTLLPILENEFYPTEVFESCLYLALKQHQMEQLPRLLDISLFYEAHLLAALYASRDWTHKNETDVTHHFQRISYILQDPNWTFPTPSEQLSKDALAKLTRDFIDRSLIAAGIKWFSQRLFYHRHYYQNWECAAKLRERSGDLEVAWKYYVRQWQYTQTQTKIDLRIKTKVLNNILNWAEANGFQQDGLRVLKQGWQHTSMSTQDVRLWEQRLNKTLPHSDTRLVEDPKPSGYVFTRKSERDTSSFSRELDLEPTSQQASTSIAIAEPERIIQQVASVFDSVHDLESLAKNIPKAEALLGAVHDKHSDMASDVDEPIRQILRLVAQYDQGVDEDQAQSLASQMKAYLEPLRRRVGDMPVELRPLAKACDRVVEANAVRTAAVPDLRITPPADLKLNIDPTAVGEQYVTRLFTRIHNPGLEAAHEVKVDFTSPSESITIMQADTVIPVLLPKEKQIIECDVEVRSSTEKSVDIQIFTEYKVAGVRRHVRAGGQLSMSPVGDIIPVAQRYITGAPVSVDRTDLFHGRSKEIEDLQAAFADGRLRRLYFVNGIRRVGKSTLMQHLGLHLSSDVLPLLLNLETILGGQQMTAWQLVRQLIRESLKQVQTRENISTVTLTPPGTEAFELDPPWTVFDDFLENLKHQTEHKNILLCFDEVQRLVERIADPSDPMDDGFLSWLRGKAQAQSDVLLICTGSEPYAFMRKRYEHTLWGNMEQYNVSFVSRSAMENIATLPVQQDGVTWLSEALDRLYDMTEGHPWITQLIAAKVIERLNDERRRVVGPGDVEWSARLIASDSRISDLWWNEKEGLITEIHRNIAFLILRHQSASRCGLHESELTDMCRKVGIYSVGKHLEDMRDLEILTFIDSEDQQRWRIRGAFLEQHLRELMYRSTHEAESQVYSSNPSQPLALMLDWENIFIRLTEWSRQKDTGDTRRRLDAEWLAEQLSTIAAKHGSPQEKWAAANWDGALFQGHQKILERAGYETIMSGDEKANASDHKLTEKIHKVLRDSLDIQAFIIGTGDGDFKQVINTLRQQGKYVVIWTTREALNNSYKYLMTGPNRIRVEWLEDLMFGEYESTVAE